MVFKQKSDFLITIYNFVLQWLQYYNLNFNSLSNIFKSIIPNITSNFIAIRHLITAKYMSWIAQLTVLRIQRANSAGSIPSVAHVLFNSFEKPLMFWTPLIVHRFTYVKLNWWKVLLMCWFNFDSWQFLAIAFWCSIIRWPNYLLIDWLPEVYC